MLSEDQVGPNKNVAKLWSRQLKKMIKFHAVFLLSQTIQSPCSFSKPYICIKMNISVLTVESHAYTRY